ncbi:replicative DNA helicase [Nonomuraea sp. NPDC046570]|uniref:replicative DNA helicase n=1 Tax=Nonomuraea sp. NPDC046570 TaxID=3155255 RepID=UPI0033F6DC58
MLLSKDAVADVVEILRSDDFYRPAHQIIYDIVTDLYGRGEPADAVTVFDEVQKRGEASRVGGGAYLHTLTAVVPTAANAGYYAKIVREQAILRRLIEAGTRIVSFGYGGQNEEVDDLVDRAQAEIYKVTERRTSEDYAPLADIMPGALDELEAIGSRGGQMVGVPTGFQDLDSLTNGLHPGQMIVVAARPAIGKALALDTPLPTPTGWTTMGQVEKGDLLIGADGRPTEVVAATPVLRDRPCYEVEFGDGTVIVADAQHQWRTRTSVMTTVEIAGTLGAGHVVEGAAPFELPDRELPHPPYEVGLLLAGAGGRRIPEVYLRASAQQRGPLLSGLLDAGGPATAGSTRSVRFAPADERLARDVQELALTLGRAATLRVEQDGVELTVPDEPGAWRIVDVRPVPSRPVRCVEVDNPDHLYLAGRTCVPTHNSTLGLDFARSAAIKHGMTTVIFSLEMSRNEITMRLLSAEARVALHSMRSGLMSDDDWTRLARRMSEVAEAPLFIDDSPNMSMMEIRAKCRRLKQRNDLKFVVIDYLQLMSSPKKTESRQNEVSEISRAIKLLAKELEVPVIAISQLNRGPEQRTDKRPAVSDLRESGCLTAATRILRADTGAEVSLGELLESGARDIPVWSLDERLKLVPRTMTHVFSSGVKQVYRVRLRSGREVDATANHPFLTYDGWRALGDLDPGARVAVARHVPAPLDGVPSQSKKQIALSLRGLWAQGGDVRWDPALDEADLSYASTDRRAADEVARLLLRFNVMTRIDGHRLHVHGAENQLRFLQDVGVPADHAEAARECVTHLRRIAGGGSADAVPEHVWDQVRSAMTGTASRRAVAGRVAAVLDHSDLDLLATNDVHWDEIASVEALGEQPVYDATVLGTHNFIANGISLHNSIEQDADMVILLHREDAYERESPRAGEADLIVAKHRNGPTATVTVAFQGHYSRFVDMAQH